MGKISKTVGSRIRLYRRIRRLSLSGLGAIIHKSKATLSKYETGDIIIDVETLCDIADALDTEVGLLLDPPKGREQDVQRSVSGLFSQRRVCLYYYDGRRRKIVKSLVETYNEDAEKANRALLYYDMESMEEPESCKNIYVGTAEFHDTVTNYLFTNQSNRIEHLQLCAVNPFDRSGRIFGMLMGISRYPMLPVCIKCVLSSEPLPENDDLIKALRLSKKDMGLSRSMNMFVLDSTEEGEE